MSSHAVDDHLSEIVSDVIGARGGEGTYGHLILVFKHSARNLSFIQLPIPDALSKSEISGIHARSRPSTSPPPL